MTAMDYRQYDNALGRFNSIDALAETSYSFTPYAFSYNNPVYWADPTGLLSQAFINSLWDNSAENSATKWVNDGEGTFSKEDGSGMVDQETGEFTGFDTLRAVTVTGRKTSGGGSHLEGNIGGLAQSKAYSFGKFYGAWRSDFRTKQFDEFQDGLDWLGTVPGFGEPVDLINAGISTIRGDYGRAGLSLAAMMPIVGWAATGIKQSHHIIPKAVYREMAGDLAGLMKRDGIKNLIDIPVPFHGNHPQYNKFVKNELENLKRNGLLSSGSIEALQGNLRNMIEDALKSGDKLNDYFRQFN